MTGATGLAVRGVTGDGDRERLAAIVNATSPEDPTSLDEMHWSDATYPGTTRLLAELDGRAVGAATVGRIFVYPPDHPAYRGSIGVLPGARRQGIGERLLRAISDAARSVGNDEANAPMRAVNARLGYRPLPDEITMRGPIRAARDEARPVSESA